MLGLAEADVDMIWNFGTVIDDDAIRSLVLSTKLIGEIMIIINHTDCGMLRFTDSEMEGGSARRRDGRQLCRPGSTTSPTPRRTPGNRFRRPDTSMDLPGRSSQGVRL
jgi:carbonic anhydrase